jgi:hypothetical protein
VRVCIRVLVRVHMGVDVRVSVNVCRCAGIYGCVFLLSMCSGTLSSGVVPFMVTATVFFWLTPSSYAAIR